MNYEVGDKVYYKNTIFLMEAEIIEIDPDDDLHKYHIEYKTVEGKEHRIWVTEKHLDGFVEGSEKYLMQELNKLMDMYNLNEIERVIRYLKED